jgi:Replication-relaxation
MTRPYLTAMAYRAAVDQLGPRDLGVARYVAELRFVSGSQLARLCFGGTTPRAARQGLLRLTRLGVLERLPRPVGGVRAGSAGFVYCLGLAGQRLAIDLGWLPEHRTRRSLTPGMLFVRHALMVSELHVRLIEAERRGDFDLLALNGEPACWRKGGSLVVKPDSFVRLGFKDFEYSYFIEVDRATSGSRAIGSQIERYLAYYASGQEQAECGVFPLVLWLVPDERRADVIGSCIGRLRSGRELFRVAPFEAALAALASPPPMT